MKHNNSPSLFSFSPAYVLVALLFGLVLSLVFPMAIAAQDDGSAASDGERGHARSNHREGMRHRMSSEERQAHMDAKFSEIDSNLDDMISPDEWNAAKLPQSRRGKHFGRRHHSGQRDGSSVERAEGSSEKRAEKQAKLFESMDSDSDGTLSQVEFSEMHTAREGLMKQHIFQRMDKNADGLIGRDEFSPGHMHDKRRDRD